MFCLLSVAMAHERLRAISLPARRLVALGVLGASLTTSVPAAVLKASTTLYTIQSFSLDCLPTNMKKFGEMRLCELHEERKRRGAKMDGHKKDLVER